MKNKVFGAFLTFVGLVAWYITYGVVYESWVPYYYEDYLVHIFLAGVFILLLAPVILYLIGKVLVKGNDQNKSPSYFSAVVKINMFAVVILMGIFVCNLNNSIFPSDLDSGYYQIVPEEKN